MSHAGASMAGISAAATRAMRAPTEGFCDATTSTSEEYVDLSEYAGHVVTIYCETVDHYICFSAGTANVITTAASPVGTAGVPFRIHQEAGNNPILNAQIVVPKSHPYLHYKTVSATGIIRVIL